MSSTPIHGNQLTEVVKHCRQECFGDSEGPGAQLKSQVDEWRGGLRASLWLVGLLFAVSVGISITAIPALVDAKIAKQLDARFGKGTPTVSIAPGETWTATVPIAQAHAETKGVSP